jgi:hypothetical protein
MSAPWLRLGCGSEDRLARLGAPWCRGRSNGCTRLLATRRAAPTRPTYEPRRPRESAEHGASPPEQLCTPTSPSSRASSPARPSNEGAVVRRAGLDRARRRALMRNGGRNAISGGLPVGAAARGRGSPLPLRFPKSLASRTRPRARGTARRRARGRRDERLAGGSRRPSRGTRTRSHTPARASPRSFRLGSQARHAPLTLTVSARHRHPLTGVTRAGRFSYADERSTSPTAAEQFAKTSGADRDQAERSLRR